MYVGGPRGGWNTAAMFGPTIRVSPDTNISLRLTNELIGAPYEKVRLPFCPNGLPNSGSLVHIAS